MTAGRERNYAAHMLLAALLLALQPPAQLPPDLDHGFTADSVLWVFDVEPPPPNWLLRTNRDLPIVPEQGGLLIDPPPRGEFQVVLRERRLHGRGELGIGWNVDLPPGTGLVLELAAHEGGSDGVEGPWVRVQTFGEVPPSAASDESRASPLERTGEGWCTSTSQSWVALRLRAFRSIDSDRRPIAIARLSLTLSDQTRPGASPQQVGCCGLGLELLVEAQAEALRRAAELAVLELQPLPESGERELGAFASCAAMLATGMGHPLRAEALAQILARGPRTLGERCQSVHASGCRTWIEAFSILPDVRQAQGTHGPLALRVRGPEEWVVLGSLDRFGNARIYSPGSALPQPETWSPAELGRRWLAAGGLAFACRH